MSKQDSVEAINAAIEDLYHNGGAIRMDGATIDYYAIYSVDSVGDLRDFANALQATIAILDNQHNARA